MPLARSFSIILNSLQSGARTDVCQPRMLLLISGRCMVGRGAEGMRGRAR